MKTNKTFGLMILAMLVLSIGMASAYYCAPTEVVGKVYMNPDITKAVDNASVKVTCNGYQRDALSDVNGNYAVEFHCDECAIGSTANVVAIKDSLYGASSGVVKNYGLSVNIGIVNVPLVPEFGLGIGALTILSAVGIFFFVRKK